MQIPGTGREQNLASDAAWILGQMSGTSFDGIDLSSVLTNGVSIFEVGEGTTVAYGPDLRRMLRKSAHFARSLETKVLLERESWSTALVCANEEITRKNAEVIGAFLNKNDLNPALVGFHGQTILHRPHEGLTVQLGDGHKLASALGLPVIWDFRSADMQARGQGAPLAPFYHHALVRSLGMRKPCAILNLGGIANVSFVNPALVEPESPGALLAFDTGPGNGLLDEWMQVRAGRTMDRDGACAATGTVNQEFLSNLLDHPFLRKPPPKSLDKAAFSCESTRLLSIEDGAATLTAFTACAVAHSVHWVDDSPKIWLITGGGRLNSTLMRALRKALPDADVQPVETVGLDGDRLEAQAFAFLAGRSRRGYTLSAPSTTGCLRPQTGGQLSLPLDNAVSE